MLRLPHNQKPLKFHNKAASVLLQVFIYVCIIMQRNDKYIWNNFWVTTLYLYIENKDYYLKRALHVMLVLSPPMKLTTALVLCSCRIKRYHCRTHASEFCAFPVPSSFAKQIACIHFCNSSSVSTEK